MASPVTLVLVVHGGERRGEDYPSDVWVMPDNRVQDPSGSGDGLVKKLLVSIFRQHMGVCCMHDLNRDHS